MSNDITDEFFDDYERDQNRPNLKLITDFILTIESYSSKDFDLSSLEIKYKKPLRVNKWTPPSKGSLF